MANTGFKGVDLRQTGSQIVIRASLKDSSGAKVTGGTTSLYLYEIQSDGTFKSFDFNDFTFKTGTLTTETAAMSHRSGNNGVTSTGIWSYALSTLTGFTIGAVYLAIVSNSGASPAQQEREFQYGSAEGDLITIQGSTGNAKLNAADLLRTGTAQAGAAGSITLDAAASATDHLYRGLRVTLITGTGGGQSRLISGYIGSTKVASVLPNWTTAPDNTTVFVVEAWSGVDLELWGVSPPNALQSGRPDVSVGAMAAAVLTATAIASDAITAAKIANDAITSAKLADDAITAAKIATDAIGAAELASSAINEIRDAILSDSTPFAGANIGAIVGYVDELESRLTAIRAGYLDNLNIGGNVASSAEATAIQNNTRVVRVVPPVLERPDSGSITYRIEVLLYDSVGNMEAPDSAPTIALVNQAGTDRSSRLDSTTMTLVSTGRYRAIYTADVGDALEQLVWAFSVIEGSATRIYGNTSLIVDTTAVDFTAADRVKLDATYSKLPSKSYLAGTNNSDGDIQLDEATGTLPADSVTAAALATDAVTEIQNGLATATNLTTLLNRVGGFTGSGVNTILGLLKSALSKTATVPTDVGGTFDPSTDSAEAIRDRGDVAWADSGAAPSAAAIRAEIDTNSTQLAKLGNPSVSLAADILTRAAAGDAMALTTGERSALAAAILDLADGIETGITLRQSQRLQLSVLAGKISGADANAPVFRDVGDTKDRITAETDAFGNRTSVTVDAA